MNYFDLDDNEFDNFLRNKAKRKRARRALLSGGASEMRRGGKKRRRLATALLSGGASEMRGLRNLRRKCKEKLANARFASRRAKRKALKECIMEAREQIVSGVPAGIRIPQGRPRGGVMGMLRG